MGREGIDKDTHEEFGIERLFLVSRGRRLSVGSFLGPDEKASFAAASAEAPPPAALRKVRRENL